MKLIDSELYDLAIALADSAARSDIECLCVRTGADRRAYRLQADDESHAGEVARAAVRVNLRGGLQRRVANGEHKARADGVFVECYGGLCGHIALGSKAE